ncbi:hypothetical protein [Nonomuraea recticatena]|uniref:hypothetical protein n=1 Tax=Nonomuraea recticatena TaxID=46178 RepID=UPI00360776CF
MGPGQEHRDLGRPGWVITTRRSCRIGSLTSWGADRRQDGDADPPSPSTSTCATARRSAT